MVNSHGLIDQIYRRPAQAKNAEERVADKYDSDVKSCKETIKNLQAQVDLLKLDKEELKTKSMEAAEQNARATKEAEVQR